MIVTIDDIPVYDAILTDDETGMLKISLVDAPAVMSNFQAFDRNKKPLMYAIEDEEKRLVRGVVMRADFPIYRRDASSGEYYIIYKADTIRQMAEKYLLESRQNDVNLMHEEGSDVDGVQMVQYFIKESAKGISPAGFEDIADGSLFAEFHIVNDDVWAAVKDGTYKGFSLEGIFDLVPETNKDEVETIVDILKGAFSRLFNSKNKNMSKLSRFKAALAKVFAELGSISTDKGVLVWDGDDDLKVGDNVYIEDEEGNRTAAEDGEYKTDDASVIVVESGVVVDIKDDVAPVADPDEPVEMESIATDNGELIYNGELAVGTAVYVASEEGNVAAPDGDYVLEDGTVINVVDGVIASITEPKPEEENPEIEELRKEKDALKAQVKDLQAKLAKLKKMSAAGPAHDVVKTAAKQNETGVKGLDNITRLMSAK